MKTLTKCFLLLVVLLCSEQILLAQAIKGTVVETEGNPIELAHVIARKRADSTFVAGCLTDAQGRFAFDTLSASEHILTAKCIGYKARTIAAQPVCNIILEGDATELSEVVVLSSFVKRSPSGDLSVRIQGNPIAKGKSLMETLRYIQGVEVLSGNILVNGKDHTIIYLGDRKITAEQLRSIPTNMVKHIEVIPNAGASFGQEAQGGIVRVTLRQKEGLIGAIGLTAQADGEGFVDAILTPTLQYQFGKLSVYNNLKLGTGNYRTRYKRQDNYGTHHVDRKFHSDKESLALLENLALQYQLTPTQSLQVYGGLYLIKDHINQTNHNGQMLSLRQKTKSSFIEGNAGLLYRANLNVGKNSSFSTKVEYLNQSNSDHIDYELNTHDENELRQRLSYLYVEPRLELKSSKGSSVNLGIRFSRLRDRNEMSGIASTILTQVKQQDFQISGGDFAPWVEYSRMIGQRAFVQVGLTYQLTDMKYSDYLNRIASINNRYSGLYPNVQLQYMLNPQKQSGISIAYRRDYSLPNYGYYSPVAVYQNEKLYSIGNQNLKEETFHSVEANYYINPNWILTYRLKSGANIIHLLAHRDPIQPDVVYTRPENSGTSLQHYTSLSYTASVSDFWQTNNRVFVRHNTEKSPGKTVSSAWLGWSATQQFRLSNTMGLTLSATGQTAEKHLSHEVGLRYDIDAGVYMSLLNDQLQINLGVLNLIHNRAVMRIKTDFAELERMDLSPRRRLKLSVTWHFSSGDKIKRSSSRTVNSPTRETPTL